ncbi:MAG: GNAT family protein [Candidatus Brocadiia bacterium]
MLERIKKLKYSHFGDDIIKGNLNGCEYDLILMTDECAQDQVLMGLLANWRKQHEMWFPAQFKVTVEGTTKWFQKGVIETPDRLLFVIKVKNKYIGHIGLFRFDYDKNICEIDNIVRGEPGCPGLIGDAIKNMMEWGQKNLNLGNYSLKVMSDNAKALNLYDRLGFMEKGRIPLIRIEKEDRIEWVEAPANYTGAIKRYYVEMLLSLKVK